VTFEDRRGAVRVALAEEHGILEGRVRAGHAFTIVNISASGAFVQCVHRLLPGRSIELQLIRAEQRFTVRGLVVRCGVSHLSPASIWYRGAVKFDSPLRWLPEYAGRELRRGPEEQVREADEWAVDSRLQAR
jgi:hypothetical protein